MIGPVEKLRYIVSLAADRRLHATNLCVAIVITDHYNDKIGYAWPGYARLTEHTGFSRASVARSVKKLDQLGLIKKDRGGIRGGSDQTATARRSGSTEPVPEICTGR